ncbi:hypothetical protein TVNIR_3686 [Thioalkalivibrio nitratireducens DSM 14787]|uniref:Uncharacterized protein n=1 Tax=Thioalkalivibrio nitratireducens (strain DSM 14787 / UNIQEM 213 / ALEN2) TaxID=1255043 RepID=L0E274_THIND|nr:hypothetical protein [Thioalkalivibrio nitratireducens]AGA35315.1 hypothetical protein TVNIR_3686 [Thioalkalivibrio nitratireducens DSM 14787]
MVLGLFFGLLLGGGQAFAGDAQAALEQAREASNLVRSAERHFHSGRLEQARDELAQAEALLEAAEAEGDLPQVRGARSRFDRLNQNVQRRLEQAAPEQPGAPAAPATAAPRMSGAQARDYRLVDQDMRRTRDRLTTPRWWDLSQSDRDQRLAQATTEADEFRARLDALNAALDPALLQADPVHNSEAGLTEIRELIAQRRDETEPAEEVPPAVAAALELKQTLLDLHQAHRGRFQGVHGNSMVHGTSIEEQLQVGRDAMAQLDALDGEVIPAIQPTMRAIAEHYGETAMAINNSLHALGLSNEHHFGSQFMDLYRGMENTARSRSASAQDLVRRASMFTDHIESFSEEMRLRRLGEAREMLVLGQAFDPTDPELNQLLAQVDVQYAAMEERIERDIDARQWVTDIGDFAGPGQTDELARAALEFFRGAPAWNPAGRGVEVLAVSIQGQWDVANRDLFGRPIQWRVPVHMVMTNHDMKEDNIARVYELSVLAREGSPSQPVKAAPFVDYWVGNSWNMRLSNVPAQP